MDELNQIKADFKSYNAVVEEVGISVEVIKKERANIGKRKSNRLFS